MNANMSDAGAPGNAADELKEVVGKAEELLESLGSSETVDKLRQRVTNTVASARSRIVALEGDAKKAASQAANVTDEYVHSNPWTAVALGAVVGAVAAALLTRRI